METKEDIKEWIGDELLLRGWSIESIERAAERLSVMPNCRMFDLYSYHMLHLTIPLIGQVRGVCRKTVWLNITSWYGIPAKRWNILTAEEKERISRGMARQFKAKHFLLWRQLPKPQRMGKGEYQ